MPMTFDSFKSVMPIAKYLKLREPQDGESLEDYRHFVADHNPDKVEAQELRTGRPWDKFTPRDKLEMLASFRSKE